MKAQTSYKEFDKSTQRILQYYNFQFTNLTYVTVTTYDLTRYATVYVIFYVSHFIWKSRSELERVTSLRQAMSQQ